MPSAEKPLRELGDLAGEPADIGAEDTAHKGVAGGYAALDADGNLDPAQLAFEIEIHDNEF